MSIKSKTKETIETYNKSANAYQKKFMKLDLYNDTYDLFCNLLEKDSAHVFEIATGPGNITRYLLSKRPDFKLLGIDISPNMIKLAQKNNPSAQFQVMNCMDINSINKLFDGVICGFCLPYLSKVEVKKLIRHTSKILNPTGIFYLSTMEGDYNKSGFETTSFSGTDRVYIYYHQEQYLKRCLLNSGFEVLNLFRKDYLENDGTTLTDLIIIAQKRKK